MSQLIIVYVTTVLCLGQTLDLKCQALRIDLAVNNLENNHELLVQITDDLIAKILLKYFCLTV